MYLCVEIDKLRRRACDTMAGVQAWFGLYLASPNNDSACVPKWSLSQNGFLFVKGILLLLLLLLVLIFWLSLIFFVTLILF